MPSLSDKLKSLGVQVGPPKDLKKPRREKTIDQVIPGTIFSTQYGETFIVENTYPATFQQGQNTLSWASSLETVGAWAGESHITGLSRDKFAFLDTETSGLMGGTGTYVFMVGVGKFEGNQFRLAQFFMRDPAEELAHLAALEAFLAPCEALVTYNGKSFDVPLLNTRYTTHGWPSPLVEPAHLDLLHLARRLWRARLSSRRLGDLEAHILQAEREADDVPGWMIPEMYFDYLRYGEVEPLKGIFYHNAMDILSLAALFTHIATLLDDPTKHAEEDIDLLAIGKLHHDLGHIEEAKKLYAQCIKRDLPDEYRLDAIKNLSFIHKKNGEIEQAMQLWQECANSGAIFAHEELAKVLEHQNKDYSAAIYWTQTALDKLSKPGFPILERLTWKKSLEHRLSRLQKKAAS